jgi:hypothetical protein
LIRDESRWTDHAIEQSIGRFLQVGVMLAAAVVLVGATLLLMQHGSAPVSYAVFHSGPQQLRTIAGIVRGALALDSKAIVQLGLLAHRYAGRSRRVHADRLRGAARSVYRDQRSWHCSSTGYYWAEHETSSRRRPDHPLGECDRSHDHGRERTAHF